MVNLYLTNQNRKSNILTFMYLLSDTTSLMFFKRKFKNEQFFLIELQKSQESKEIIWTVLVLYICYPGYCHTSMVFGDNYRINKKNLNRTLMDEVKYSKWSNQCVKSPFKTFSEPYHSLRSGRLFTSYLRD